MNKQPSTQEIFSHEHALLKKGYDFVIGIDEAGRGPLAGPVVASACSLRTSDVLQRENALSRHPMSQLIRDSKKLSERQRESLFDFIQENFYVGVGICDHMTIDRINILEATYLAMKKAVTELLRVFPTPPPLRGTSPDYRGGGGRRILLVDGNKIIPNLSMEQRAVVGGDKLVKSISAASIIAKVTRDRMMWDYHEKYPQYGFAKHKGYGTKAHMLAIKEHGPCGIHRLTFEPVKSWTKKQKTDTLISGK
jgi:ribonuclease HII